jgi:hypothetical protein
MQKSVTSTPRGLVSRYPKLTILGLIAIFLAAGIATTLKTQNYITILWRIGNCPWKAPHDNYVMIECPYAISDFYRIGSMFLDIDPRVTGALRKADVIVTGNSQTVATFMLGPKDNQLDEYFRSKNLNYFIMAQEGSGFRFRKLMVENLKLTPKISVINSSDLAADLINDWNRELVFNPDRFKLPFKFTYWAIEMQKNICTRIAAKTGVTSIGWIDERLETAYCKGTWTSNWLNLENGMMYFRYDRPVTKRQQIVEFEDKAMSYIDVYMARAKNMLATDGWKRSCVIFYMVPAPINFPEVARTVAKRTNKPYVDPPVGPEKDYWVYDTSHMEVDTAKRWTKEFIPLLNPEIDKCVQQQKPS